MYSNAIKLTDEMIEETILGNINMMYVGVGVLLMFGMMFIIIYFARVGGAKSIPNEYEQRLYKKRLLKQCLGGVIVPVCIAVALVFFVQYRKANADRYHVEVVTVIDKQKQEQRRTNGRKRRPYYRIYVDKYEGSIDDVARYDEIDVGDKVYVIVKDSDDNDLDASDLENCVWTLDKYEYVGDKQKE